MPRPKLREFWESCRTIESEESGGKVLLRVRRGDAGPRIEDTCDGIIRARDVKGKAVDEAVDDLVGKIERTAEPSRSKPCEPAR